MVANRSFLTASQSGLLTWLLQQQNNVACSIEDILHQQSQRPVAHRATGMLTFGSAMDPSFLRLDFLESLPRRVPTGKSVNSF